MVNSSFTDNRLEQNDNNHTGGGEISISYASSNTVLRNTIKPNDQNVIVLVDQKGGLSNTLDYQKYYPYGQGATEKNLIFYWGDNEYDGLSAFQKKTKQETHAQVV